ncbi:MAG: hypothetical protein A2096_01920 [Spirochaetes bacterium GWF1_41_5]|nr:MAG: hypothetical protein A2096_01920 [Spirochaetes bacterium GWF1_41_5]
MITAFFLFSVALMRPQWGIKLRPMKRTGIDIVFLLDISRSMLAEDIKPSRLEKAKSEIAGFVSRLKGDRVGLVVFAGTSFVTCPLTIDYNALEMFIDIISPSMITRQGTDIGHAVDTAAGCFNNREFKYKAVILLTDGEDHSGKSLEAAKEAKKKGIRVYTIGIGSRSGEIIPVKDENSRIKEYIKDQKGQVVLSRLDEVILQKISVLTGGKYFHSTYGDLQLDLIYDDIQKMEKRELESEKMKQYEDRYQIFVFCIFLLLFAEVLVSERRKLPPEAGNE